MKQNRRVEDYLKVIYRLRDTKVRGVDIARELGLKKPTVSVALKRMEDMSLVAFDQDRGVVLTEAGENLAREVTGRYDIIYGFLLDIGVDEQTAHEDACYMEHGISESSLEALQKLRRFLHSSDFDAQAHPNKSEEIFLMNS